MQKLREWVGTAPSFRNSKTGDASHHSSARSMWKRTHFDNRLLEAEHRIAKALASENGK